MFFFKYCFDMCMVQHSLSTNCTVNTFVSIADLSFANRLSIELASISLSLTHLRSSLLIIYLLFFADYLSTKTAQVRIQQQVNTGTVFRSDYWREETKYLYTNLNRIKYITILL